jgi:hypothetical protein
VNLHSEVLTRYRGDFRGDPVSLLHRKDFRAGVSLAVGSEQGGSDRIKAGGHCCLSMPTES